MFGFAIGHQICNIQHRAEPHRDRSTLHNRPLPGPGTHAGDEIGNGLLYSMVICIFYDPFPRFSEAVLTDDIGIEY